jgi:formylglycine-generating enzyme required for sulfatase activity
MLEKGNSLMLDELSNLNTSHQRRLVIGEILAQEGDKRSGVGLGADGLPDIEWCSVEAGTIEIEGELFQIDAFSIAKYPVTYGQFQAFVDAEDGYESNEWWLDMPEVYQQQTLSEQRQPYMNHPRDGLSWYQAVAFSRWMNAHTPHDNGWMIRLPLEWEWQWAAQGCEEKRLFPFGDWQNNYANTAEAELNRSIAVGMYPHGQALCGALDMAGNVWEWCLNDYENIRTVDYGNEAKKVRRGGSFNFPQTYATTTFRDIVHPYTRSSFNGMRLCWHKMCKPNDV